jgi:hypothetical protein
LILIPILIVLFVALLWRTYCRRQTQGVYKQIAIPDGSIFVIEDEESGTPGAELTHSIVIDAHQHNFSRSSSRDISPDRRTSRTKDSIDSHTSTMARTWFTGISEIFYPSGAASSNHERVVGGDDNDEEVDEIDSLPVRPIIPSSSSGNSIRLQHLDQENRATINIVPKSIAAPLRSSSAEAAEGSSYQTPPHSPRKESGGAGRGESDDEEEEYRKLSQINRNMLKRSNSKLSNNNPFALDDQETSGYGSGTNAGYDRAPYEKEERGTLPKRVMSRTNSSPSSSSSLPQLKSLGGTSAGTSSSGLFSSLWSIFQGKREAAVSLQEMSTRPKASPPAEPIHLGVNLQDEDEEEGGMDSFAMGFISPNMSDSPVKASHLPLPPPLIAAPAVAAPPLHPSSTPQGPTPAPAVVVAEKRVKDSPRERDLKRIHSSSPSHSSPRASPLTSPALSPLSSPSPRKATESPTGGMAQLRKMTPSPTLSRRASSESVGSGDNGSANGAGAGVWATVNEKRKAEKRVKNLTAPKTSPGDCGDEDNFHPPSPLTSDWFDNEVVFSHAERSPQRVTGQEVAAAAGSHEIEVSIAEEQEESEGETGERA